jgi:hypothetical protein
MLYRMESRAGVLREYERWYQANAAHSGWPHIREFRAPERVHRWRVKMECGCNTEALTMGAEYPPTKGLPRGLRKDQRCASGNVFVVDAESSTPDRGEMAHWEGRLWCSGHDVPLPWREITEWVKRTEEGHVWTSEWKGKLEHHGPVDRWKVRLSCGLPTTNSTPVGWLPEHGFTRDPEKAEKIREKMDGKWEPGDFLLHWVEQDCPSPRPDKECIECAHLRPIVSYEPIGRLTWPGDTARPSPDAMKKQLDSAESRVHRLMAELEQAEQDAAKIRKELSDG